MKRMINAIKRWAGGVFRSWSRELYLVFTDPGVLLFFFGLPLAYPLVYTLIYNPEVARNIPVVVVDHSRTSSSRELARMVDATEAIAVAGYADDMAQARVAMNEHKCYGIMEIPAGYARQLGRGDQAVVPFYSEMSLLLRYRGFVQALTNVQLATGSKIQNRLLEGGGLLTQTQAQEGQPIENVENFMGDPAQGFASFVMPGIVVLILQQSLILGVAMLAGGRAERRRRNGGTDPLAVEAPTTSVIVGRVLCYVMIYLPMTYYITHLVPIFFALPHLGNPLHHLAFLMPMLVASALLGIVLGNLVTERETSLMVVVFTSVAFLFLSGLTWPRYAMNPLWLALSDMIPATWGVQGFIRMNSNDGSLAQQSTAYMMLWVLSAVYAVPAYLTVRYRAARRRRILGGNGD